MKCQECIGNGNCAYNIMLPYIKGSANVGEDSPTGKMVNIDKCLLPEILTLWEKGIKTTGCCCGHGLAAAYIGVRCEYREQMLNLGYIPIYGENTFKPITQPVYGNADKGHNWWSKGENMDGTESEVDHAE